VAGVAEGVLPDDESPAAPAALVLPDSFVFFDKEDEGFGV